MQKTHNGANTIRVLEAPLSAPSPPPITTTNGGGVPACASCRHQRKKCTEKCILAPFFPAEKTHEFQAVHKIFGVSNVTKLVKDLPKEDGKRAVDSLIWEANCRLKDPVLGPLGEFQRVCEELKAYKTQYQQANIHPHIRQVPITQGAVLYNNKSTQQRLIGSWNGDNNSVINNGSSMLDYINGTGIGNGGGIDNSRMFGYGLQSMEKLKQERDQHQQQGSLIHPQQQIMNDFNQFY